MGIIRGIKNTLSVKMALLYHKYPTITRSKIEQKKMFMRPDAYQSMNETEEIIMEKAMDQNMKELNNEEMEQVSGGDAMVNHASHHFLIEGRQRQMFEEMKLNKEQTADIRMRAAEEALKAASRLGHQESEIREAMKANRELLGLK